ncbi:MAG: hypothetical protein N3F05_02370 [Candidatus Diapherotrites archaeon]|nr:hypothetical protein [Candidatus Diapherotrites archaeon]
MELPISVIITIFVALAVGAMLLALSQGWLSGLELQWTQTRSTDTKVIQQISITNSQIGKLLKSCYEEMNAKPKMEYYTCYAITVENPITVDASEIAKEMPGIDSNKYHIDSGTTRSITIFWNYPSSKVEVRV